MAGRFDGVEVGDQLMRKSWIYDDRGGEAVREHYLVTDCWFDPCKGQRKSASGEMVAVQRVGRDGQLLGSKYPHTRRGLASNGYQKADMDYIKMCEDRLAAMESGQVIGIGAGRRNRPKPAGGL